MFSVSLHVLLVKFLLGLFEAKVCCDDWFAEVMKTSLVVVKEVFVLISL